MDDLVLRSAYLRLSDDMQLRKLAHDHNVSKSDLIRAAIHVKLNDWRSANDPDAVLRDLAFRIGDSKIVHTAVIEVPKAETGSARAKRGAPKSRKQPSKPVKPAREKPAGRKTAQRAEDLLPA